MSKQIQAMIASSPDKFESWHTEIDGYGESHNSHLPSYWVYCRPGFIIPEMECGTVHTKTVAEALVLMKTVEAGCYVDGYTSPHYWVDGVCQNCNKQRTAK